MSTIQPLSFSPEELDLAGAAIDRIKAAAKNLNYTQKDLSVRSGIAQAAISNIFKKRSASVTTLMKLTKAVHYDMEIRFK